MRAGGGWQSPHWAKFFVFRPLFRPALVFRLPHFFFARFLPSAPPHVCWVQSSVTMQRLQLLVSGINWFPHLKLLYYIFIIIIIDPLLDTNLMKGEGFYVFQGMWSFFSTHKRYSQLYVNWRFKLIVYTINYMLSQGFLSNKGYP